MTWASDNPERHRENVARWRAQNAARAREVSRQWYQANKDRAKETARLRKEADPEAWAAAAQARTRRYRQNHPEVQRAALLRQNYRLSPDQYADLLYSQGGTCAICRGPETACHPRTGTLRSLAVDHDHATGAVRGLLCSGCNVALGHFGDDPDRLERAASYLRAHATRSVI